MKTLLFFGYFLLLSFNPIDYNSMQELKSDKLVVVELFTSQGCYSCPPADRLLIDLAQKNENIIPLAYHVDYWNYLGWKDQFSREEFSQYQRKYAKRLDQKVYTPQMVINGKKAVVGSRESEVLELLQSSSLSSDKDENQLKIRSSINENFLKVFFNSELSSQNRLILCLVKKIEKVSINAGENSGKTLDYGHIVIERKVIVKEKVNSTTFRLNQHFNKNDFELIGYLQDKETFAIKNAMRIDF